MRITPKADQIIFDDYFFKCASIFKSLSLIAGDIEAILPSRAPPEVWLKSGEVIFVSAESLDELIAFADRHSIHLESRVDVWSLLNEEFLDTQFSKEEEERVHTVLAENNISREETISIRKRVGKRLLLANSMWWEWLHLGHYDMLRANQGITWLLPKRFKNLYWHSMSIARRGKICDFDEEKFRANVESLFKVELYDLWKRSLAAAGLMTPQRESYIKLVKTYEAVQRSYHNISHIQNVVAYIDKHRELAENWPALLWAGWLHDFYPPWEKNAEALSAFQGEVFLKELGMQAEVIERVKALIVFTANHFKAGSNDERLIADADLYILGEEACKYDQYSSQIRREYAHVSSILFNNGRRKFLVKILEQVKVNGRISYALDQNWELRAKENLSRELVSLGGTA